MNADVTALTEQKEDFLKRIELRDKVRQLEQIPLFKEIVLDKFCTTEAARYATMSGDISIPETNRANSAEISRAGGHLRRWMQICILQGDTAKETLEELEQHIQMTEQDMSSEDYDV